MKSTRALRDPCPPAAANAPGRRERHRQVVMNISFSFSSFDSALLLAVLVGCDSRGTPATHPSARPDAGWDADLSSEFDAALPEAPAGDPLDGAIEHAGDAASATVCARRPPSAR